MMPLHYMRCAISPALHQVLNCVWHCLGVAVPRAPNEKAPTRGADSQLSARRVSGGRARTSPPLTAQQEPASFLVPCVLVFWGAGPQKHQHRH